MRKYKSLLFREYKLSQNHYLIRFIILTLFLGLVFLTILINRDESQETINSVSVFMSLLFAIITGFLCADDADVYQSDIHVGWHTYSYCLPISLFEKSLVRYLVKVLAILVGVGITALGCQVIAIGAGTEADMRMIFVFLLMAEIYLLLQVVIQAVSLAAKDLEKSKKTWALVSAIALGIIIFGPDLISIDFLDVPKDELGVALPNMIVEAAMKLIDKIDLILFPLLIILLAAGFIITYKTYERRRV